MRLDQFPKVNGQRFEVRDEHWVYHGFGVWAFGHRANQQRLCFGPNRDMAETIRVALEHEADRQENQNVQV